MNGVAFNIANSSAITNINNSISNINTRVTNIESHGTGSTVSFDQNTMTLTINGVSYSVSDGSSLASAIAGKTLV